MKTETEVQKSNDLRYTATKTKGGKTIYVKIRLNDECKNGHQDFSITGDLYEAGKPKIDKYHLSGGCIHDEVLKFFPEFKIFVDLHLCDYKGIPMYCVASGFYHLEQGFNSVKPEQTGFKEQFCEYYRVTPAQFNELKTSKNRIDYCLNLQRLGIFEQWQAQATDAIKRLEFLTDTTFVIDSKRTQFDEPTKEEFAEEAKRKKEGYYTPEAEAKRAEEYFLSKVKELEAEAQKDIDKANLELQAKKAVLIAGGYKALDNCIFYNHTKELCFNWRSYDQLTPEFLAQVKAKIILPEGVTITEKK